MLLSMSAHLAAQRTITAKLEEELGVPLSAHKPLIKVRRCCLDFVGAAG